MKLLPAETSASLINTAHHSDLFDLCERVYRAGLRVDMILADLPYSVTSLNWDVLIPFEPMWAAFKKITKPNAAIVLTASQPFTSMLVMSNLKMYKYSWVWVKNAPPNGFAHERQPLRYSEDVVIFYDVFGTFNKQMQNRTSESGLERYKYKLKLSGESNLYKHAEHAESRQYDPSLINPSNVLNIDIEPMHLGRLHPTQKPVALFSYLIRTYTQPGQLVFDPCVGSGTTAIAARAEGRRYIVGDSSAEYIGVTRERLAAPYTPMFAALLTA